MKYGIMGGFIKFAFAKTAFGYMEKELPEIDMPSYKKRVLAEYKAIVGEDTRHRKYERQYVRYDDVRRGVSDRAV